MGVFRTFGEAKNKAEDVADGHGHARHCIIAIQEIDEQRQNQERGPGRELYAWWLDEYMIYTIETWGIGEEREVRHTDYA